MHCHRPAIRSDSAEPQRQRSAAARAAEGSATALGTGPDRGSRPHWARRSCGGAAADALARGGDGAGAHREDPGYAPRASCCACCFPGGRQLDMSRIVATRNPYAVVRIPGNTPADIAAGAKLFSTECAACHGADAGGGTGAPPLVGREFKHGDSEWAAVSHDPLRSARDGDDEPSPGVAAHLADHRLLRSIGVGPGSHPGRPRCRRDWTSCTCRSRSSPSAPGADWAQLFRELCFRAPQLTDADHARQREPAGAALDGAAPGLGGEERVLRARARRHHVHHHSSRDGRGARCFEWPQALGARARRTRESAAAKARSDRIVASPCSMTEFSSVPGMRSSPRSRRLRESHLGDDGAIRRIPAPTSAPRRCVARSRRDGCRHGRRRTAAVSSLPTMCAPGKQRWRFDCIPGPGMPGHDTWSGDSWKRGGAGSWMTGSYDPQSDTLYWGCGGPKPDFDRSSRTGVNLYSNSVVALRGETGKLLWYFQFTPGDCHDWDSTQAPVIADRMTPQGVLQKRLLWANRNGFYYVLNRDTGAFIAGSPFRSDQLDGGPGCERPPDPLRCRPALDAGAADLSGREGRHQLVAADLRPGAGSLLRARVGAGHGVLPDRADAARAPRDARSTPLSALWMRAPANGCGSTPRRRGW